MKRLTGREWGVVAFCVVLLGAIVCGSTRQKVVVKNPSSAWRRAGSQSASLGTDKLVFLEIKDFGHTALQFEGGADEKAYKKFGHQKGSLAVGDDYRGKPFVVRSHTKVVLNLEQDTSVLNATADPYLVDSLPWTHTASTPIFTNDYRQSMPSWLRHSLTITDISQDGTVAILAGKKRMLLRLGEEITAERSAILWRSTVTVKNIGVFEKKKVHRSKWLRVEQ